MNMFLTDQQIFWISSSVVLGLFAEVMGFNGLLITGVSALASPVVGVGLMVILTIFGG